MDNQTLQFKAAHVNGFKNSAEFIQAQETAQAPQTAEKDCPTCGNSGNSFGRDAYVYALGKIQPRFSSLSLEKEFLQVAADPEFSGLTGNQLMAKILTKPTHRYLARHLCWVFTIQGIDTYILKPRDVRDYDLFAESVREDPRPTDIDIIIGGKVSMATPDVCNGLMVPIVFVDQTYSFDIDGLIQSLPQPKDSEDGQFLSSSEELFWKIMQMTDNAGSLDEHKALNYLAVRYPVIYTLTYEQLQKNSFLSGVESKYSRISGTRKIINIIYSFTNRATDVTEKFFVRVDVTEKFPFLASKIAPYYER